MGRVCWVKVIKTVDTRNLTRFWHNTLEERITIRLRLQLYYRESILGTIELLIIPVFVSNGTRIRN